jgi:hypothetical protein
MFGQMINRLLILFLITLAPAIVAAQSGTLLIKKNGHKKRSYSPGQLLTLQTKDGERLSGIIAMLHGDSIYIKGRVIPVSSVQKIFIFRKKKLPLVTPQQLLLITGGVALATFGMTASGSEPFHRALPYSLAIGYAPLIIKWDSGKFILVKAAMFLERSSICNS